MRRLVALVIALPLVASCEAPGSHSGRSSRGETTAPPAIPAPPASVPASKPHGRDIRGQVIHVRGDKVVATEPMPPSPHGHGEALRAIWAADDGTAFAVGFMFTGAAGRDTGAVYRRVPGGSWQVAYSVEQNELGRVWGKSPTDVWAAGMKVLAHWDGKTWTKVPVPNLEGYISAVWGNGSDLWVTAGHQFTAHVYHRDASGTFSHELRTDVMLFALGGAGSSVWAAGTSGAIFRRDKEGRWKQEHEEKDTQYGSVWASDDDDVWIAGSTLLHSRGDGTWSKVDLPVPSPIRYVWGRGKGDVFAGTAAGLYHLSEPRGAPSPSVHPEARWTKTAFAMDSAGVAADRDELLVIHNDIR